jgi:hypothetical protein
MFASIYWAGPFVAVHLFNTFLRINTLDSQEFKNYRMVLYHENPAIGLYFVKKKLFNWTEMLDIETTLIRSKDSRLGRRTMNQEFIGQRKILIEQHTVEGL